MTKQFLGLVLAFKDVAIPGRSESCIHSKVEVPSGRSAAHIPESQVEIISKLFEDSCRGRDPQLSMPLSDRTSSALASWSFRHTSKTSGSFPNSSNADISASCCVCPRPTYPERVLRWWLHHFSIEKWCSHQCSTRSGSARPTQSGNWANRFPRKIKRSIKYSAWSSWKSICRVFCWHSLKQIYIHPNKVLHARSNLSHTSALCKLNDGGCRGEVPHF